MGPEPESASAVAASVKEPLLGLRTIGSSRRRPCVGVACTPADELATPGIGVPTRAASLGVLPLQFSEGRSLFTLASIDSVVEARVRGKPFKCEGRLGGMMNTLEHLHK